MSKSKGILYPMKRAYRNFGSAWRGFVKQIKTALFGGLILWGIVELVKALH